MVQRVLCLKSLQQTPLEEACLVEATHLVHLLLVVGSSGKRRPTLLPLHRAEARLVDLGQQSPPQRRLLVDSLVLPPRPQHQRREVESLETPVLHPPQLQQPAGIPLVVGCLVTPELQVGVSLALLRLAGRELELELGRHPTFLVEAQREEGCSEQSPPHLRLLAVLLLEVILCSVDRRRRAPEVVACSEVRHRTRPTCQRLERLPPAGRVDRYSEVLPLESRPQARHLHLLLHLADVSLGLISRRVVKTYEISLWIDPPC